MSIRTRQSDTPVVGEHLEVLGFPEMGPWTPVLEDAIFRRTGPAVEPLVPISVTADQELSAGSHDSRLVTVEAELVDLVRDAGRVLLVAKSKNVLFDAEIPQAGEASGFGASGAEVANGSRVRLTGISMVRVGRDRDHPTEFRLLLRSVDDIVLVQKPPLWTIGRAIWILAVLAAVAALALAWGVALGRRVKSQTAIIRKRIENENALEARYRDLFENANDAIYTHDTSGRFLTVNRAGEALTGYSRAELAQKTIFDLAMPARREALGVWLQKIAAGEPTRPTFESELLTKDGRSAPVEVNVRPILTGEAITAVEGVARDITERRRAESELGSAQRRLAETSRRAGMAEVVSGVLHNVGGALSAAKDAAARLSGKLKTTAAPDLHDALADAESLGRSLDHIDEIMLMQQGYARASGAPEETPAETLIEDALRINRAALERAGISVAREYSQAPNLLVEKPRVLQILVNLLSNARQACEEHAGDPPPRIVARIDTPKGERAGTRVRFVVADNGVGIPHEHLGRIFENGFTTKNGAQGIGLHSASLAARELGGALFVHSDGAGRGARFTLELPVRPPDSISRTDLPAADDSGRTRAPRA